MNHSIQIKRFVWGAFVQYCLFLSAFAQTHDYQVHSDYVVKQWTVEDGLPGNTVFDVHQTQDGYVWIATGNGLARFDGVRFTTYTTSNTPVVPNNRFAALFESQAGDLWILTEQSHLLLYKSGSFSRPYEPDQGRLSTIYKQSDSRRFLEESDTLWIGTDHGLSFYHDGQLRPYRSDEIQARVWTMLRDRNGSLWLGTFSGDILEIRRSGEVHRYSTQDGLPGARIHSLHEDRTGRLWVGTRDGIYFWQPASRSFRIWLNSGEPWIANARNIYEDSTGTQHIGVARHSLKDDGVHAGWYTIRDDDLERFPAPSSETLFASRPLTDPDGYIWRFQGDALYRDTQRILQVGSRIQSLHFDREGNLWVGTQADGLFLLHPAIFQVISREEGLPDQRVKSLLEDRNGTIWIGTESGLAFVQNNTVSTFDLMEGYRDLAPTYFPRKGYDRVRSPGDIVWGMAQDRSGTIWIGTNYEHCYVEDGQCVLVDFPDIPQDLYENVAAIHEDRLGRFWLGSKWGLIVGFPNKGGTTWTRYSTDNGLSSNWIRAILETRQGSILLGSYGGGLLRYDDGTFETINTSDGLASDNILEIYEDENDLLWIGTEDRGLCQLDRQGRLSLTDSQISCINVSGGLFDNTIYRILPDDFGRLWMNTSRGIFWVDKASLKAFFSGELMTVNSVGYTEQDGLRNRQGSGGVHPAGIKASDGRLWFPTRDGVAIVDPARVQYQPKAILTVIEDFHADGEVFPAQHELTLAARNRNFQIDYTALSFSRPDNVHFRYVLEGFDDQWNYVGVERRASYTNVPPGQYTFRVAAGTGSVWDEAEATLSIKRLAYFWETNWFLAFGLLLGSMATFGIFRYRIHQVEVRNRDLEQKVAERTAQIHENELNLRQQTKDLRRADELKSRFLANISHEFRTPLTLTLGPLEDLRDGRFGTLPEPANDELERIRRNAQRLLRLVNQLLDLSILEEGGMILRAREYDLAKFVHQLTALFESIAAAQSITLQVEAVPDPHYFTFDSDKLEKVIINLLSNAFKFTPPGGSVTVKLYQDDSMQTIIQVADTGRGIPPENLENIFDRFYQVDGTATRRHEGTGIGLALVKELTELHGGNIQVESHIGGGTTFSIQLPASSAEVIPSMDDSEGLAPSDTLTQDEAPTHEAIDALSGANGKTPASTDVSEDETLVLIVDDNAEMRTYIHSHLSGLFSLVEAENGFDGLALARKMVPDLILSDVMMPIMDGFAMCESLKTDERTSHIPVILLTAKVDEESRLGGLEIGADAYLTKPFKAEELRLRVRKLIEQRKLLRSKYSQQVFVMGAKELDLPSKEVVFLEQVHEAIEAHVGRTSFGVDFLAEEVNMSRRQLLRKLRALTDETPTALIRRVRLERAAQLLKLGSMSAKEVAYETGFQSVPYFSKAFRDAYGKPPSAFAKAAADVSIRR